MDDPLAEFLVEKALHTKMLHGLLAKGYLDQEILDLFTEHERTSIKPDMIVSCYPKGFGNDG